jgi:hypothetical protein
LNWKVFRAKNFYPPRNPVAPHSDLQPPGFRRPSTSYTQTRESGDEKKIDLHTTRTENSASAGSFSENISKPGLLYATDHEQKLLIYNFFFRNELHKLAAANAKKGI